MRPSARSFADLLDTWPSHEGWRVSPDELLDELSRGLADWASPGVLAAQGFLDHVAHDLSRGGTTAGREEALKTLHRGLLALPACTEQLLYAVYRSRPDAETFRTMVNHPNATVDLWREIAESGTSVHEALALVRVPGARADALVGRALLRSHGQTLLDSNGMPLPHALPQVSVLMGQIVQGGRLGGAEGLLALVARERPFILPLLWRAASAEQRADVTSDLVGELLSQASGPARVFLLATVVPTLTGVAAPTVELERGVAPERERSRGRS